ncbi:MAG TPA: crotonase/enoyl-CoA hydratase family protein [Solirubrobacteraceae bacterium]|jgi:enoyl-CoA hydratase|nr:crotonase/enoyl-CoA hydratase family protein [Solirubrobacteraceae bacterium]
MDDLTRYELDEGIATIAIDDGKVNALSIAMLRSLHAALDRAERDGAVVVLVGRDGCFSAGFDLKTFGEGAERALEMLTLGGRLTERLLSFPTPVVVACSGHAVAAGSFVLLAADVRLGVDGPFKVGLNEVRIGLTMPWFVIALARGRLHPAHFDAAVVRARMYDPTEAVGAGFLDRVVPAQELRAASVEAAGALTQLDQRAYRETKLRARGEQLERVRTTIEEELTPAGLGLERALA